MPLYMDLHNLPPGVTPRDIAIAHVKDVEIQWKYSVKYSRYWFDQDTRKAFCLVDAPTVDAAVRVHREGHGLVADKIIPVAAVSIAEMLGAVEQEVPWASDSSDDPPLPESAFRTILFTDMQGSTAETQRLGDAGHMKQLRTHNDISRRALGACGGREVKHTGDGIMASFASVASAVECATMIQRDLDSYNEQHPNAVVRVSIGISAGEPVAEHSDLFGAAVQLAARVCAHAEAGQILVPNVIRELCIGKNFSFVDRGETALKGFDDAIRVYEVAWRG